MLTKSEFETLNPFDRGYAVYMAGVRDDEPNIPNEANSYPKGTKEHHSWNCGQQEAYIEILDSTP